MEKGEGVHKVVGRRRAHTQRLQLACEPCKAAKLKCDRRLPVCEQCYRRSRESLCKYTERGLRHLSAIQDVSAMREKMGRVQTFVHRVISSDESDYLEATHPPARAGDEARSYSAPAASATTQVEIQQVADAAGELKLRSSGSTHWVNASHWESMIEDIADVSSYLDSLEVAETRQNSHGGSPLSSGDTISPIDPVFGVAMGVSLNDIIKALPPRIEIDRLIAAWFNVADPTRVIVHAPTFQSQYQSFWLEQQRISPAWLALLLFTSSLGAEMVGQNLGECSTESLSDRLIRLGTHALVLADPARPQPYLIEALVFYATTRLFRLHDTDSKTWQILGHTMRLCYQAGYHRDPSRNLRIMPFDCEMRRRVWMVVCELDISVGSVLGTFSWRDPKVCDTAFPANLDDADFSPRHMGPARPQEDCTLVQTEICFSRLVQVMGEITASYHAVQAPTRDEVCVFRRKLDEARDLLPEKLSMKPLEQSFIDPPTLIIDRIRLEFVYLKSLCVLYRRYLGDKNFADERRRRFRAASSVVELSRSMLTLCHPGRQLAPLRLMIVRHVHDFNFAAMLLCAESRHREKLTLFEPTWTDDEIQDMELLRPKLLEGCELWQSLGVPSAKAAVALRAVASYLQGNHRANTPSSMPEEDGTNKVSNIPHTTQPTDLMALQPLEFWQDFDGFETFQQTLGGDDDIETFLPSMNTQCTWSVLPAQVTLALQTTRSELRPDTDRSLSY